MLTIHAHFLDTTLQVRCDMYPDSVRFLGNHDGPHRLLELPTLDLNLGSQRFWPLYRYTSCLDGHRVHRRYPGYDHSSASYPYAVEAANACMEEMGGHRHIRHGYCVRRPSVLKSRGNALTVGIGLSPSALRGQ